MLYGAVTSGMGDTENLLRDFRLHPLRNLEAPHVRTLAVARGDVAHVRVHHRTVT